MLLACFSYHLLLDWCLLDDSHVDQSGTIVEFLANFSLP